MGNGLKFVLYFIIGGTILTLVTYYGRDKGLVAAFIAMFPMVTAMSIITIYSEVGSLPVLDYVRGLLILTPVWILFLFCILYLLPKQGLFVALGAGVAVYLILAVYIIYYL